MLDGSCYQGGTPKVVGGNNLLVSTYKLELLVLYVGFLTRTPTPRWRFFFKSANSGASLSILEAVFCSSKQRRSGYHGRGGTGATDYLMFDIFVAQERPSRSISFHFLLTLTLLFITNPPNSHNFFLHFCWDHGFYFMNLENPTFLPPGRGGEGNCGVPELFRLRWEASD
jgi:hypothetical protein